MKKTNLFGMLALSCALVFGMVSCKNEVASSGTDLKDVVLSELSLKGTWKCTEYEGTEEVNDKEAFKALYGYDYVEPTSTSYKPGNKVFETESEAYTFFRNRQIEAENYARAKELATDASIEASLRAMCSYYNVTFVEGTGDTDATYTLDGDSVYTEEMSETMTITFKKDGKEYTLETSQSMIQVWEKQ